MLTAAFQIHLNRIGNGTYLLLPLLSYWLGHLVLTFTGLYAFPKGTYQAKVM